MKVHARLYLLSEIAQTGPVPSHATSNLDPGTEGLVASQCRSTASNQHLSREKVVVGQLVVAGGTASVVSY